MMKFVVNLKMSLKDIIEYHLQESIIYLNVKPLVGENFSQIR